MAMNEQLRTHGVAASSGTQVLASLTNPVFVEMFQERYMAEALTPLITDSSVFPSELRSSGDLAIIPKAPEGEIFEYTKNQELEISHLNSGSTQIRIDHAWYWNLKIDDIDVKQIKNIGKWVAAFQENSLRKHALIQSNLVLQEMAEMAHICNKGNAAGAKSHSYKLGQAGAPLVMTASGAINPISVSMVMQSVLREQFLPNNDLFIAWPQVVEPLFMATPVLLNAYISGEARSSALSTSIPKVLGLTHHFTATAPSYTDTSTGNPQCYAVVFGSKSATGYVMQFNKSEVVNGGSHHMGQFWRGLMVAGWGVIRPEALGVAYIQVTSIY